MYAQMVQSTGKGVKTRAEMTEEEARFQDRIDAGEKIEPPGIGCPRATERR